MNYRILILSFVIFSIIISSCKDNTTNPVKTPQITSISPTSAFIGDYISIIGTNFGATQGTSFVSFNTLKATDFLSWSETLIKVKVPVGTTSGKLSITTNSVKSNEVDFAVTTTVHYDTIKIGTQVWMKRNLDVDHYRNGDPIPEVKDSAEWTNLTTGAWCYYNNISDSGVFYGKLYNWFAVTDPRGLAPVGWHVASDVEWKTLEIYLGMSQAQTDEFGWRGTNEARKLKETGTSHWSSPNTGATNESGFSALPGGVRSYFGSFRFIGNVGSWWSSTEGSTSTAWYRNLDYGYSSILRYEYSKATGSSVRCIKDN